MVVEGAVVVVVGAAPVVTVTVVESPLLPQEAARVATAQRRIRRLIIALQFGRVV
jgi:hypothetical protein